MLPMAVAMVVSAPSPAGCVASRGPRLPLLGRPARRITWAGSCLIGLTAATPVWYAARRLVSSASDGLVNAADHQHRGGRDARAQAGVAAGIASTSRQIGSSLGVAVVGSILVANLHGPLTTGFASATRPAWWLVAAMGAVVLALALATTGRVGRASAARTAELIERAESRVPAAAGSAV